MGTWHTFDNYGYILDVVPDEVMNILKVEREKYRFENPTSRTMNNLLVGQINKEYDMAHIKNSHEVFSFLNKIASDYLRIFNVLSRPNNVMNTKDDEWSIELDNIWMNIQERGEYNPIHSHGGVISFVIWFEIPYDLSEENNLDNARYSNTPSNADFFFHPFNILGKLKNVGMGVDKTKEGTICMFHAEMLHSVNPFYTSNKQRVTFAGNFSYKGLNNVQKT